MPVLRTSGSRALRTSAARGMCLAVAAMGLAALHLPWRPPTLCLLRATTGIPCPLCGSTTAAVALGRGEFTRAFLASPLAVLGACALILRPHVDRLPRLTSKAAVWGAIAGAALLSELWQLRRFGFL